MSSREMPSPVDLEDDLREDGLSTRRSRPCVLFMALVAGSVLTGCVSKALRAELTVVKRQVTDTEASVVGRLDALKDEKVRAAQQEAENLRTVLTKTQAELEKARTERDDYKVENEKCPPIPPGPVKFPYDLSELFQGPTAVLKPNLPSEITSNLRRTPGAEVALVMQSEDGADWILSIERLNALRVHLLTILKFPADRVSIRVIPPQRGVKNPHKFEMWIE